MTQGHPRGENTPRQLFDNGKGQHVAVHGDFLCESPAFENWKYADHIAKEMPTSLLNSAPLLTPPRLWTPRPVPSSSRNGCTPREQPRSAIGVTAPHQEQVSDITQETFVLLASIGNYLEHVGRTLATYASVESDSRGGCKVLQPGTLVALRCALASLVPEHYSLGAEHSMPKATMLNMEAAAATLQVPRSESESTMADSPAVTFQLPQAESDSSTLEVAADTTQLPQSEGSYESLTPLASEGNYQSEKSGKSEIGSMTPMTVAKTDIEKVARLTLARTLSHSITKKFSRRTDMHEHMLAFLEDPSSSTAAWWYAFLAPPLVLASVLFSLLQTCTPPPLDAVICAGFELALDSIFLLEFCFRFVFCPNYSRFLCNPYNLIDMLSFPSLGLRIAAGLVLSKEVRAEPIGFILLCVIPVCRLLKTLRRFQTFQLLLSAFSLAFEALPALMFVFLNIALVFASLIYAIEPRDNIATWPEALWLTIITMTTVGYGDKYPTSDPGRICVSVLVIVAQLYSAIPVGIIGNAFNITWQQRHQVLAIRRTRALLVSSGFEARDIPKLFRHMDVDGDGRLNLTDFRAMLQKIRIGLSEDRILELFQNFDMDGDGSIDEKEFVRAIFPRDYDKVYQAEREKLKEEAKRQRLKSEEGGWLRRISISSATEVPADDMHAVNAPYIGSKLGSWLAG